MAGGKNKGDEVDENLFMDLVSRQGNRGSVLNDPDDPAAEGAAPPAPGPQPAPQRAEPEGKRRRVTLCDYDELLLGRTEIKKRNTRTVYVSDLTHARLTGIVNRLTEGRVSISDYVENILAQHFEFYGEEINERNEKLNREKLV